MPVIKPGGGGGPTPTGGNREVAQTTTKPVKEEQTDWILIVKKGESVRIEYED